MEQIQLSQAERPSPSNTTKRLSAAAKCVLAGVMGIVGCGKVEKTEHPELLSPPSPTASDPIAEADADAPQDVAATITGNTTSIWTEDPPGNANQWAGKFAQQLANLKDEEKLNFLEDYLGLPHGDGLSTQEREDRINARFDEIEKALREKIEQEERKKWTIL